jgi:hypothetical protein
VGINEVVLSENSRVNIFPNPGKDLINIVVKPETTSKLAVAINDQRGRVVFREEMIADAGAQHSFKWDTGNLPAGVYFTVVEITDNVTGKVQRESKKIVVTK